MKARYLLIVLCLFACATMQAQNKPWKKSATVKEFKTAMKEKKYDAAKTAIDNAIGTHEEAKGDAQLYSMKTEAIGELISAENRKIYLNQKPDTAKYFKLMLDLYTVGLQCDSIDCKSPKPKHRSALANRMQPYYQRLVAAGKFFYNKKDYASAYKFFDMYISAKGSPVFTSKKIGETENVSHLATLSAYGSNNHRGVMRHLSESLKSKQLESKMLEIGSKSTAALGDTTEMVNLLENGFHLYPNDDYFFLTLVKYYNDHRRYETALEKASRMVDLNPKNRDYLFIKAKEQMLVQQFDSAAVSFSRCVEQKPDDYESWASLANIYLHKAQDLYASLGTRPTDEQKKALQAYYNTSCTYFENTKKYNEKDTSLWLEGLREVYFKLNKGKELKALEKYK